MNQRKTLPKYLSTASFHWSVIPELELNGNTGTDQGRRDPYQHFPRSGAGRSRSRKSPVGYLRSRLSDKEKESFSSWVRKHEYPDSALEEQRSAVFGRKILFSIIVALYNTPIDYLEME